MSEDIFKEIPVKKINIEVSSIISELTAMFNEYVYTEFLNGLNQDNPELKFESDKERLEYVIKELADSIFSKSFDTIIALDNINIRIVKNTKEDNLWVFKDPEITKILALGKKLEIKEDFTEKQLQLLSKYVTNVKSDVYCFKNLPEEVTAVLLSYVSRSPNTFKKNLLNLIADDEISLGDYIESHNSSSEKASKFHEKWVLNYGHASCAELANIKFGIDKISILASKELEDNRLGSYIEKSTRYVKFDTSSYFIPSQFKDESLVQYCDLMDTLFISYNRMFDLLKPELERLYPKKESSSLKAYENSIKAKSCDILRYILPASTFTSLGASFNARTMSSAITKMLSSDLPECNDLGRQLKFESLKVCPTLVKYAEYNSYLADRHLKSESFNNPRNLHTNTSKNINRKYVEGVKISVVDFQHFLNKIYAYICFLASDTSIFDLESFAKYDMSFTEKKDVIQNFIKSKESRGRNSLSREFECIDFDVEIISDYGAFRDLQRHRMVSLFKQMLTPSLGFSAHPDMKLLENPEIMEEYYKLMYYSEQVYNDISKNYGLILAQYCLPMAFNIRYIMKMNFRELVSMIELRSKTQGHISYRQVAQEIYRQLIDRYSFLKDLIDVDLSNNSLERLEAEEKAIRRANGNNTK